MQDIQSLEIYTVCQFLEQEGYGPAILWVRRVARSGQYVCLTRYKGPPHECAALKLLDKLTGDHFTLDEKAYSYFSMGTLMEGPSFFTPKEQLAGAFIDRDRFRAWLESAGYPLPKFWYGSTAPTSSQPQQPEQSASPPVEPAPEHPTSVSAAPPPTAAEFQRQQYVAAVVRLKNLPNISDQIAANNLRAEGIKGVTLYRAFVEAGRWKDSTDLLQKYDNADARKDRGEKRKARQLIQKKLPLVPK